MPFIIYVISIYQHQYFLFPNFFEDTPAAPTIPLPFVPEECYAVTPSPFPVALAPPLC